MIYFDNAATTEYKPKEVIDAVNYAMTVLPYNPNRGGNKKAIELQQLLYDARKKISLVTGNGDENRVVFTSGCTEALNMAILGTAKRGHVVITATEHNSVIRPVMQLKNKGLVEVSLVTPDENGIVTADAVARAMRSDTYLVCVSHASNVTGTLQNVAPIGKLVREKGAMLLVDTAQSMGYVPLNMQESFVDMLAFSAHKGLHGIQGSGAFVFNKRVTPRPVKFGGTGTESHLYTQPLTIPDGLESGTLPCPSLLGMSASIDWWLKNFEENDKTVATMQRLLLDGLKSIDKVTVYSQQNKSGIVAFNVKSIDSNAVADALAEKDIAVRGGLQCAPLMHKYLGTFDSGVVRASVSCKTTREECYTLLNEIESIAK